VSLPSATSSPSYPWALTQESIDALSDVLWRTITIFNIADSPQTERIHSLLNDMRLQCCHIHGASDPMPELSLSPRFAQTGAPRLVDGGCAVWGREC
jgi:hypothetical protein